VQEVQQARQVQQAVGWANQVEGAGGRVEVEVEAETVKRVEGEWGRRERT
jgi:hypothetical protein